MGPEWTLWTKTLLLLVSFNPNCFSSAEVHRDILQARLGMASVSRRSLRYPSSRQNMDPRRLEHQSEAEDDRKFVTIDLSALRPSLPGLVLYKYGDLAPKLVQIDLATLNPRLQPHVVWPQFHQQMGFHTDLPFDLVADTDTRANIPYLGESDMLLPKPQRFARLTSGSSAEWPDLEDLAGGDIYDFIPDSPRNAELMTLHDSLPLADEVIVPLDWEQEPEGGPNQRPDKRNVFVSQGWKPGGYGDQRDELSSSRQGMRGKGDAKENMHHTSIFGSNGWRPGKKKSMKQGSTEDKDQGRSSVRGTEIEMEEKRKRFTKKNVFFSKGWGPGGRPVTDDKEGDPSLSSNSQGHDNKMVRISGQESWTSPKQQWNIPHLFGTYW